MRTDPDGLPHHDDRRALAEALRAALAERCPDADGDLIAAIGAMAASRFFGVRFRAEGNAERAWVARRPNPEVCEIWDPTGAIPVWDVVERLPHPDLYRPTPEGMARVTAKAGEAMAVVAAAARLAHALAAGVEPDDA
ncbi:hypothetical protein [Azospirillum rugosum]|uniref:Uncharacterized protein n=1 Tax=Azospirillum rugosum TaxID=416170 RepID=A0ABS4SX77_9PROT|nr:hypothetical protein [Azospirillum rugosum]MBP2296678.1 hypothetical protein [Azospirillum rugosum]MDQ0530263.1 hypothetical protein [Azospirillum rugosum]